MEYKGKTGKERAGRVGAGDVVVGGYYAVFGVDPISTIVTDSACELLTIKTGQFMKSITTPMEDKLYSIGIRKRMYALSVTLKALFLPYSGCVQHDCA